MKPENIPLQLRERNQWCVWKSIVRDGQATKLPFQVDGGAAKSNDPATWTTFEAALAAAPKYSGIGFVFDSNDPYCGVDLDGCRDPKTGKCAEWARSIILELKTYAEVSPSGTGVKLFCRGKLPFPNGKKIEVTEPSVSDKTPAIELYDHGRYFAVTGLRLTGQPHEPQDCQTQIDALCAKYFPVAVEQPFPKTGDSFYRPDAVLDRARKYLAKMPPAVSGSGGHDAAFHAACVLVCGFSLTREQALQVISEWNQTCVPPWNERELTHKIDDACKQPGERGYLRNANEKTWHRPLPVAYKPTQPHKTVEWVTMGDAARKYIGHVRAGDVSLIDTGIPDLDAGLGGGIERGEMIVLGARPSHGKSLIGLQCVHNWTAMDMPVLFVTEEMSPVALGKRTLQYASELPVEHWKHDTNKLENDLTAYEERRAAECYIAPNCGTVAVAQEQIEKAVKEFGVQAVVVDYAQLLVSPGKSRYEQITHTSETLRRLANELHVTILVLCQMSRAIESRKKFEPYMSDIKETGQFEQDADVVLFCVWPHRIDSSKDPHEFKLYVAKNRNRPINSPVITCNIVPSRQMLTVDYRPVTYAPVESMPGYEPQFQDWSK